MGKDKDSSQKSRQRALKHMKQCLSSLKRKIQIKPSPRHHFLLSSLANIKQSGTSLIGECSGKQPSHALLEVGGEGQYRHSPNRGTFGKVLQF